MIDSPTHRLGNILDLVITNSSSLIGLVNVMPTGLTDTCDHYFSIQSCLARPLFSFVIGWEKEYSIVLLFWLPPGYGDSTVLLLVGIKGQKGSLIDR